MKVLMVSGHGCIRMQKMAIALMNNGHEVHLISHKKAAWHNEYASFMIAVNSEQMHHAMNLYTPYVDIIHVHNEPNWYVAIVKEHTDKPVILDIHDSWSARYTPQEEQEINESGGHVSRISSEERLNFQLADALIVPGESFGNVVRKEFNLKQPHMVLPSYVPRRFYRYSMPEWIGGIVYEGRVDLPSELKDPNTHGFRYTDYSDFAEKCNEAEIDFHIYSTREDKEYLEHYKKFDTIIHPRQHYDTLIKVVSRHDWGLVGNSIPTNEWKVAFPNKMFEYIAAGVPVMSWDAEDCSKWIEEEGIGITVSSTDEIKEKWGMHRELRKKLIKNRLRYCMESHIGTLEAFYGNLL